MKILLIGEFSGLHWTLAQGLRQLGHQVTVVSDGDGWKNYDRDINLDRKADTPWEGVKYIGKLLKVLPKLRGYDVVQLINPCFLNLKPSKSIYVYRYLRKHNKKVFLGAFGVDHYWVKAGVEDRIYRYSDFNIGSQPRVTERTKRVTKECLHGGTAQSNIEIARSCQGIVACLWEYYAAYQNYFPEKLLYAPLPIDYRKVTSRVRKEPEKVNFFIGIQSARSDLKGTDIMYPVLQEVQRDYPDRCTVTVAQDVPFAEYERMMDEADVQLDQLYSYTPSMNSLLAMAKGVIVVGGGEPENYEILGEKELRPIVNVYPSKEDIRRQLVYIIEHKHLIPKLSAESIEYVHKHHNYVEVARRYAEFWQSAPVTQSGSQPR